MLLASVALTLVVGVAFSVLPAWRATHGDPLSALRHRDRRFTGSGRLGQVVVVTQVALSLLLVTNAVEGRRTVTREFLSS